MRYLLDRRYRFRGWHGAPYGIYDSKAHSALFFDEALYRLLMRCDAVQEIETEKLAGREARFLEQLEQEGVVRQAGLWDFLREDQKYHAYPARYRRVAHWSVTGACNLKCRHCFMSAPHAKHGSPTYEQLVRTVEQLAECGVFSVEITGGEPLIRDDLPKIVSLLNERGIALETIYTNGWLVDGPFLDMLEAHGVRPGFQLSFDGIGCHDYLRGVPGAEERTVRALRLLQARRYSTAVSMCLHRKNASVLRDSVNFLASLGVSSVKCGAIMDLGEWKAPEAEALKLTREEELSIFAAYIPQYFADGAPLALMLSGAFAYTPGEREWFAGYRRECAPDQEGRALACGVLGEMFYIGADGLVSPCQGMCDCEIAGSLSSLYDRPLREILTDSEYVRLSYATVGDVRNGNSECRTCEYVGRCSGGCRNSALIAGKGYYGVDPDACSFFRGGWEERIRAAAAPAFAAYLKKHPPAAEEKSAPVERLPNCL